MLALIVVGAVGYGSLGLDQFPKVDFPTVLVTTRLNGAAPEEIETEVSDKLEGAINTISGIDELRSTSSEGVSQVVVSFVLGKNPDVAAQEVRDHINNILPDLPKDIDQPVVTKVDPDASPILYITVRAPGSVRDVTELADKRVRRQIESISGVGQVTIVGGRKRQINVWLDPSKLEAAGLTATEVRRALASQNLTVPGGELETGPKQVTLRVEGRVATVDEVGRIVVKESSSHATRIEDVARVEDGAERDDTWSSEDGVQNVVLSVRKQSGENTVAVVDDVRKRLDAIQGALPAGTELRVVRDNSASIRTSVDAVKEHLVLGSVLAALIVLVFLANARSTIIAALAIPISIIGTFGLMWAMGFTLNLITLLALALAVGIVIDDAIVVLENIVRFIDEKGMKPFPAAIAATKDIGLAVLATTLSLMAVFIPVSFMGGIVGQFLKSFGLTMAFAIFVSLLVSFSLTPMLSSRWLRKHLKEASTRKPLLERVVDVFYRPIESAYLVLLRKAMAHRWVVVVACGLVLASVVPLAHHVKSGFLPENDTAEFEVNVRAPEGTSLLDTRLLAERIATAVRRLPGVEHTLVTIGNNEQKTPNLANIYVHLVDPERRRESQLEILARVRREIVAPLPQELRVDVSEVSPFSTGSSDVAVQYTISGPDLNRLSDYTKQVLEKMKSAPGAVDVDSNLIVGKPQVRVTIDRERAADLGVEVSDVADALQLLVGGLKVTTYEEGADDYDIRMRADAPFREDAEGLAMMTVPSRTSGAVKLASVVRFTSDTGPSQVNRLARQRQATISSNVAPGYGESDVQARLASAIADLHLPATYRATPAGRSKDTGDAARNFAIAFAISFIFMYLVLAAQFESWLHPVTIMVALPLTIPFALLSLIIFDQALSIFSALGILVLFGVVKKNAILQVDHTIHLRAAGKERLEAILESNRDRLRPILMTTLAFVAGMIPLIFSRGIGAGINKATAGVVIGGQTFSLLLTLLATPVVYSLFDDVSAFWRRKHPKAKSDETGENELDGPLDPSLSAAERAPTTP
jgi:hydrophobe/amphiphile efflux-1 (HAE1) family protein